MGTKAEPLDHNSRHMQTLSIHHCGNNALNMTFFPFTTCQALKYCSPFFTLNDFLRNCLPLLSLFLSTFVLINGALEIHLLLK